MQAYAFHNAFTPRRDTPHVREQVETGKTTYVCVSQGGYEPGNRFTIPNAADTVVSDSLDQAKANGGTVYLVTIMPAPADALMRFEVIRQVWPEVAEPHALMIGIEASGPYSRLSDHETVLPAPPTLEADADVVRQSLADVARAASTAEWRIASAQRALREARSSVGNPEAVREALGKLEEAHAASLDVYARFVAED